MTAKMCEHASVVRKGSLGTWNCAAGLLCAGRTCSSFATDVWSSATLIKEHQLFVRYCTGNRRHSVCVIWFGRRSRPSSALNMIAALS